MLGVAGPVPGALNRPPVSHVLQESLGCAPETRDLVTGVIDLLAITPAFAAHRQDRGASRPALGYPLRCGHSPQRPGEITATLALAVGGRKHGLTAIGQPITDDLKPQGITPTPGTRATSGPHRAGGGSHFYGVDGSVFNVA